jgi:hypothetical protein
LRCYSKEKLNELYPEGNYSIVGEMKCKAKKEEKQKKQEKKKTKKTKKKLPIGQTSVGNSIFEVFAFGTHGSFLSKDVGYACVGEDKFLIVKQSRVPFIATFSPMLLTIVACIVIILLLLLGQSPQEEGTYHPLPSVDPNIEVIDPAVTTTSGTGDGPSTPVDPSVTTNGGEGPDTPVNPDPSEQGGGSVSLIYTMEAIYKEGDDDISVYFKNPKKSDHDVVLELYAIATDGSRVLMAKSGRIPAGYGIEKMTLLGSATDLSKNSYKGLYRVTFYDPKTGELATVNTEIPDISITVK